MDRVDRQKAGFRGGRCALNVGVLIQVFRIFYKDEPCPASLQYVRVVVSSKESVDQLVQRPANTNRVP